MLERSVSTETILAEAIEIPGEPERCSFVERACGDDIKLRRQVERLIANHFRAGDFLESPASPLSAAIRLAHDAEALGTWIGPYKLREVIGEGGMGTVYVAEQEQPIRRKVALKIIKLGMDSREVLARFEAERQALALMDHPNIAKILDAGTIGEGGRNNLEPTSISNSPSPASIGRPYFVMELVRGISITEFCNQRKLTSQQRLELFVKVCQAIQHAHQKGIIHRDIKPTNVLVTMHDDLPVPKVIDFGIAKATSQQLTDKTVYTRFAQMLGTPVYMSPEQTELNALDVDTRSDVYSLGVLLYELLTDTTPFDSETLKKAGFDEMRRIIREDEPLQPSQRVSKLTATARSTVSEKRKVDARRLGQILRGELDWIVMKALEKDRTRRYESASALAADVQRYLDDEPVAACPPSTFYRLRKQAWKFRVALGTTVAIGLALIIGTGVSVWQAMEADQARQATEQQRQLAEADFDKALEAVDRLLAQVGNQTLDEVPGVYQLRDKLVDDAAGFYRDLEARRPKDARIRRRMAEMRIQSWNWKWITRKPNMEADIRDAVAALEQLYDEHPEDPEVVAALGEGYLKLASNSPAPLVLQNLQHGRQMLEACMKQHPDRTLIRDRLAQFYCGLANELPSAEGELLLHQVSTLCQPLTRWNRGIVASSLSILAQRHASRNELTTAINLARRGIETHAGAVEEVPTHSAERGRLALGMVACARLLARGGRIEEATSMLRDAARHANRTIQENPGVAHYLEVRSIVQQAIVSLANEHGGPADGAALLALHNERLAADYLARSQEYAGLGNDDLRMADLRTALKLDPNNLAAINEAYAGHLNRGEMEDAKTMALQAVAIPQERVKDWRIRGEQFQLLGEYAKAIQAFDRFADEQAGAWWIVKRRGVANFLDGRYDAALRDMTYALHAKPDEDSTLTWIDPSLLAACPNDDFRNGMLKLADEAVELNHGAPGHLATRGVLLANMKKIAEAQADFDAAIASPRARTFDLYWAAMANLLLDDREAYRDVCETMCERFRENQEPDALHWAAWTCVLVPSAVKNYDAAIVLARRAFAQRPTKQKELLGLGAVLFRASQFEEAKQHLTAAAAAPNLTAACPAFPWYFLAMTHHRLGQHEDAQEWLAQATEFTAKTRTEPQTDRGLWNRRLTLELLDAEAKALLAGD